MTAHSTSIPAFQHTGQRGTETDRERDKGKMGDGGKGHKEREWEREGEREREREWERERQMKTVRRRNSSSGLLLSSRVHEDTVDAGHALLPLPHREPLCSVWMFLLLWCHSLSFQEQGLCWGKLAFCEEGKTTRHSLKHTDKLVVTHLHTHTLSHRETLHTQSTQVHNLISKCIIQLKQWNTGYVTQNIMPHRTFITYGGRGLKTDLWTWFSGFSFLGNKLIWIRSNCQCSFHSLFLQIY